MDGITSNQRKLLETLTFGPRTAGSIKEALWNRIDGGPTYDSVHSSLRRMEDRYLVRRTSDRPSLWELTHDGRRLLETTT